MKQYVYADNAATTKLDIEAFEAMKLYMLEEYGNASQPYFFGKKAQRAIKEARKTIAECINAEPEQIFFTSGGTESNNWVIKCFGAANSDVKFLVTSEIEHHAILNAAMDAHNNTKTKLIPVDTFGLVHPDELDTILNFSKRSYPTCLSMLTSIMMVNNEIGTIQPIKKLAEISHEYGVPFHTDAVQAVGHIKIDVNDLGVDMMSASAHKFNGPKGIGFLYDNGRHLYSHNSGGAQEFGRRAGTENVASIVGMAIALKNNCNKLEQNQKHIMELENYFLNMMTKHNIEFVRNGSLKHIPGNLSLSFKGKSGEAILHRLDLKGICVSTGSACDSVNTRVSHVLKAIKLDNNLAEGTIRISLGKDNSIEDIDKIVYELVQIL